MKIFHIISILFTISAIFSYLNYKYIKLPNTIGVMLIALVGSLVMIALKPLETGFELGIHHFLNSIDFKEMLLHGLLSFLLFAGALHVNLEDLLSQKWIISLLATLGVAGATLIVGLICWWGGNYLFDIKISLINCLLFGAIISPTDPIAVLSILKNAGASKRLEAIITGESLFNDGVAVVIFLVLLEISTGTASVSLSGIAMLFIKEALGGALFGFVSGYLAYWMLKQVDNYQIEILITLALVTGGYALADVFHTSGPIAIVVAGLLIGNHGRLMAMSEQTRKNLDLFWELIDEILNAILFILIGLELLLVSFDGKIILASLAAIPAVLLTRFLSVGGPIMILKHFRTFDQNVVKILTWGGLRGGISVALALSMPPGDTKNIILAITYMIVVFSILVQGLTLGKVVQMGIKSNK